jgi:hypothetical protein
MKSSRELRVIRFLPSGPDPRIVEHLQALQVVMLNRPKMAKAILDLTASQARCSLQTEEYRYASPRGRD